MQSSGFAEVNGTHLYYEITGEGEPLVLIHSGLNDLRLWNYQFKEFGKCFKVIRYDIRGFGKSDKPTKPYSNAEDLKALLDYLNIDKIHLLGVSMGGSIAVDFTLKYPDSVKDLILSGASLNGYKYKEDEASKIRSQAVLSIVKHDENFEKSIEFLLNDPMWKQSKPEAQKHLKQMFMDTSLEWALEDMDIQLNPPASERLSEINQRTLIIVGTQDSEPIKEISKVYKLNIQNSKKVIIQGTGHIPNLDKPKIFNKIVLGFLLNN